MQDYNGRINISKDMMFFVTNEIFGEDINSSTTKENILKLMPCIYENAEDEEIIKLLPYDTYLQLEKLIDYYKNNKDVNNFLKRTEYSEINNLEKAMIVVLRAKYGKYNYTLNPGVLEKLDKIFTAENRKIAERYGLIEKLTIGMLYSYGIVEFEFYRKQLCKYMGEIISNYEIENIIKTRLNLINFLYEYPVKWVNTNTVELFITYLDEDYYDVGYIVDEQKSRRLNYKIFSKEQILNRKEFYWDTRTEEFYNYIKENCENFWKIKYILKQNELGANILDDLMENFKFETENDIKNFISKFNDWYNNSPQYLLGGFTPNEFRYKLKK